MVPEMSQVEVQQLPVDSATPASKDSLSRRAYLIAVAVVLSLAGVFRVAFGARGSFTGDDWTFRSMMADGLSLGRLFTGHNGHLNPVGLLLQWIAQQAFPGRYVPLMVISAALLIASAAVAAWWFQTVFGRRWAGVAVAVVVAVSPTTLELMTWWSVALYAAPLILTSWLTVQFTTLYAMRRCALWVPLLAFALTLLSSSKAIVLPVLLVGITAGLALDRHDPPGLRRAARVWWRLWAAMLGILAVYGAVFLLRRGALATADPSPTQMVDFVRNAWRLGFLPSLWGGPWSWASMSFHTIPAPSAVAMTVSLIATLVCVGALLVVRPRVWRLMVASAIFITVSTGIVAFGRAGSAWAGPNLRYTVDLLLPVVVTVCAGLFATRWETHPRSALGAVVSAWRGWPVVGGIATALWVVSVGVSMVMPWQTLPENWMKNWTTSVRGAYPSVREGLLWQPAPRKVSQFTEPLSVFLAGDPQAPPERLYVNDRFLGFDDDGRLIDRYVEGVVSVPATEVCQSAATPEQDLVLPLEAGLGQGRHTVSVDYTLGVQTTASVQLGDGPAQEFNAPPGARRVFVVVEGAGDALRFTVSAPTARLCVTSAVVGYVVDGPLVDPSTLPR